MKTIPEKTVRRLSPLLLLASLAAGPVPAASAGSGDASVARDTASDTVRVRNLRAFAKLYGYVRWFHPSDEAAATDWDRFAVHGARRVMDAPSPAELRERLEELFLPIAPSVRVYPEGERPDLPDLVPDDTAGLEVVAWQHRGVGLREGSQYRSVRLNRPPPLREPRGLVYRQLPADGLRDRAVRFSAAARLAEPGGGGRLGLFLQVHGEGSRLFEADMEDRPVTDTGWAQHRVEGEVAEEAEIVIIGAVLRGTGEGRVDEARLEVLEEGAWRTVDVPHGGFTTADSAGATGWTVQRSRRAGHRVEVVAEDGRPDVLAIALDEAPDAKPLFPERPAVGEATDAALGRGLRVRVPLALYGDAEGTLPRASSEELARLRRELDALDPDSFRPEDPAVRAAGVVIAWNVLQHFYPYFGVVEADWEVALDETLARALAARGAFGYTAALNRMLYHLEDGHAHASHPSLGERRGLPIRTAWIAEQVTVVATGDTAAARPGDIVLSVDGEPAWGWLEREAGLLSGSEPWRRHRALVFDRGFGRGEAGTTARLELLRDGRVLEVSAVRDVTDLPEETPPASFTEVAAGVFYVDLTRTPMPEIEARLEELASARGVIFDLRGHPADNRVREIPAHLSADTLRSGHWRVPYAIYPDRRDLVGWDTLGRWELAPRTPRLRGRAVFLSDARAVSFPEGILDMVAHHGVAEVVGRATAGVTGNVNTFNVPGDVTVSWTGMKYLKPDSARHHGIGVRPTVPVRRTPEAVRQGRDEDLERAVELIGGDTPYVGPLPAGLQAILDAYDEMAERELWPDFDPGSVPLALFDGDATWLFRHPSPPEGFRPSPEAADGAVFPGRHPAARANTSTELGGVETAVALLEGRLDEPPRETAGLLIHEAFHAFQRRHHPAWGANEMALLTYPMTDSIALGLRRLETRALRAALRASTAEERLRRVRALLDLRAERFERLPADAAAYERGTELNEGLARYVEGRALEQDDRAVPDTAAFPPQAVRRRAYATGQGLAVLLDRSVPGWKESLASDSTASLDGLLRGAVPTDTDGLSAAGAAGGERERAFARAGRDVRTLERQRRERLADFQERPGWTLEIVAAEGAPLRAQRFDPINLMKAGESRVLHTRWLVLGNEDGRVEVMDHWALTTPAGAHPLFEGIRRLTVTGLAEAPRVVQEDGIVRIEAPAVEGEMRGRAVERSDRRIVIRM